jgi:hypothetical protein
MGRLEKTADLSVRAVACKRTLRRCSVLATFNCFLVSVSSKRSVCFTDAGHIFLVRWYTLLLFKVTIVFNDQLEKPKTNGKR